MKFLLDTHTLIWAAVKPDRLTKPAAKLIATDTNTILISAASAFEIAIKVRLGRMPEARSFEANLLNWMLPAGYDLREVTADGLRAGRLQGDHQDPFDRILAAQALVDDIPVISTHPKLDQFGGRRIW